jgi:NADH dehydrogenase [ubiquinone] 1 alpha subcomplex assembly factor 6
VTEYDYCQNLVERFDPDRYLCSLFAPASIRQELMALYAFNVEVAGIRESVTEPLIGRMRLQWWIDIMDRVFAGEPPAHQVAVALSKTVNKFGLERKKFDALLDARAADFEDTPFATIEELENYAEQTSASLISQALKILGQSGDVVQKAGRSVGTAWALTGLLRAIPFHARQNRSYLPTELVKASGASIYDGGQISKIVSEVSDRAHDHIRSGREERKEVPRAASIALSPAILAEGYLQELMKADFDPFKTDMRTILLSTKARFLIKGLLGRY